MGLRRTSETRWVGKGMISTPPGSKDGGDKSVSDEIFTGMDETIEVEDMRLLLPLL